MELGEDATQNEVYLATQVKAIEFEAELRQIRSMADHTYNVTLNVPEYCLPQVKELLGWLMNEVRVAIINADTG